MTYDELSARLDVPLPGTGDSPVRGTRSASRHSPIVLTVVALAAATATLLWV